MCLSCSWRCGCCGMPSRAADALRIRARVCRSGSTFLRDTTWWVCGSWAASISNGRSLRGGEYLHALMAEAEMKSIW
jgi:hypothetical protein